ncbi:hypothetical protein EC973_008708 [Apophysomyces ossiformis]|uniref:Uncharacterized protein n=1 Tax=Apophysomyces ossiformis TaxID=679940 RepID=A0A8H7BKN5_9FUNG|nr:hypothetical protein EC973_008708 [Apophysomyces ossiformis]
MSSWQVQRQTILHYQTLIYKWTGAYTGMRTLGRNAIVQLNSHLKRIHSTLSLMKFTESEDGIEREEVSRKLASFRDEAQLDEKLIPLLRAGLTEYYNKVDQSTDDTLETKVMVMVAYSFQTNEPIFSAHFSSLSAPPKGRVKIEVDNKSRKVPAAKDSQWVRDRVNLEKEAKALGVNEVLLMDDDGRLYEGMSSNFFAVRTRDDGKPVIMTASLDHVLLGTVMKVTMAVCQKHNIDIEWSFPKLHDAQMGKWQGCFLTS